MSKTFEKFKAILKRAGAEQTGREHDKEKFAKHIKKTALKSGKPPVENQTEEHLQDRCKSEDQGKI